MSLTDRGFCATISLRFYPLNIGVFMKYRLSQAWPDSSLILPVQVLEKMDQAGEGELKLLLSAVGVLRFGPVEEEELILTLSQTYDREMVLTALAFWRGCGILKLTEGRRGRTRKALPSEQEPSLEEPEPKPQPEPRKIIDADEAPFYSAKDLADAAEAVPDFKNLVSFAEGRLEKVLNTSELGRLWSFLDYLKMPLDVVMLVIEDCVSREKRSLRYITKMLTSFQDDGIDTYEKAEAYFAARQEKALYEKKIRRLFGLGDRKLTGAEDGILETWRKKFAFGDDMLDAAYEKTVAAAKNPSIKYMNKILENWFAEGIRSVEDIGKNQNSENGKAPKSYDLDSFFEQAVSKGRKNL